MKKLFYLSSLLSLLIAPVLAQSVDGGKKRARNGDFGYLYAKSANPGIRYGIKGGLQRSFLASPSAAISDISSNNGWAAGVYAEVPFHRNFYVQTGLFLTEKGGYYTVSQGGDSNYSIITTAPLYLQLPVLAIGKVAMGKHSNAFLGLGPYFAMGIGGSNRIVAEIDGVEERYKSRVNYSSNNSKPYDMGNLNRFDAGLAAVLGVEFNKVTITAEASEGAVNVKKNSPGSFRNRAISISFGYLF